VSHLYAILVSIDFIEVFPQLSRQRPTFRWNNDPACRSILHAVWHSAVKCWPRIL